MRVTNIVLGVLAARVGLADASVRGERRLDRPKLGLYDPASLVTDHAAIDQDQAAIENALTATATPDYEAAKAIYIEGAYSKPYANLKLTSTTTPNIPKNAAVLGVTVDGNAVEAVTYSETFGGSDSIKIKYNYGEDANSPSTCNVGGLADPQVVTGGCFAESGSVTVNGVAYAYTYDVMTGNGNGRTIQGFSIQAEAKMKNWQEYPKYSDYYGDYDFGDKWVKNALDGTKYVSGNGKVFDFSKYGDAGRIEAIKKGTVYLNIYQYVLHEFEDALADCSSSCTPMVDCNEEGVHAWDEGVAFYTGSQENYLLYALADKRCKNYGTCGADGDELEGTAHINYLLMNEFAAGRDELLRGNCESPRKNLKRITELMAVPLIQGLLRYAYKVGEAGGGEKEKAEGSVFMAGVIPRIHECDPDAAMVISNNMEIGASSTDLNEVKDAVESTYDCLGITCSNVGGLVKGTTAGDYYFTPCGLATESAPEKGSESGASSLSSKIGIVFASIALYFLV
mmetsp:Transcript_3258/g.6012  ORF Transcript_3258/g.6012 Transcript_3258/m.6012 type:complete len:510 (-) Transcript_3258:112-1641(-)